MIVIVTAFPVPEHRAGVIAAFEAAIARAHREPGVDLYALHEGRDRLVMIEKYESEEARSKHLEGASLVGLRSTLEGQAQPHSRRAGPRAASGGNRSVIPDTTLREAEMSTAKEHSNIPSTAVEFAPGLWRTSLQRYDLPSPGAR